MNRRDGNGDRNGNSNLGKWKSKRGPSSEQVRRVFRDDNVRRDGNCKRNDNSNGDRNGNSNDNSNGDRNDNCDRKDNSNGCWLRRPLQVEDGKRDALRGDRLGDDAGSVKSGAEPLHSQGIWRGFFYS